MSFVFGGGGGTVFKNVRKLFEHLSYIMGGATSTKPPCRVATAAQDGQTSRDLTLLSFFKWRRELGRKHQKDNAEEEKRKRRKAKEDKSGEQV